MSWYSAAANNCSRELNLQMEVLQEDPLEDHCTLLLYSAQLINLPTGSNYKIVAQTAQETPLTTVLLLSRAYLLPQTLAESTHSTIATFQPP
jgi:uncharacterized surface protein with fasciclin (FAS1) repeats